MTGKYRSQTVLWAATIPCFLKISLVFVLGLMVLGLGQGFGEEPDHKGAEKVEIDRGLVGHWPLTADAKDHSGKGLTTHNHGVTFAGAGVFDGRGSYLTVPSHPLLNRGKNDFSLALWVHTESSLDDVPGDLVSHYDVKKRRGFHLTLQSHAGVTFNQANYRQLQFGIDNNRSAAWRDCGRPGQALLAFALAVYQGQLYAGTCEPGPGQAGRVYRFDGPNKWIDCGSPAPCNAVTALAVYQGKLFAGVGKYRLAGSALPESTNPNLGGKIFRFDGGTKWTDCGQLPKVEAVSGLVVFRGRLYAGALYPPAGFFRYEGGERWTTLPNPNGKRVEALGVYNGFLYATSYDAGHVYRFDGSTWTDLGQLGPAKENTQTYSLAVYQGRLHVGTWRSGRVYRLDEGQRWTDVGRLGEELEVMGMLVHNGRLLAGTLPLAHVYGYDGPERWRQLAQLDHTPDVRYRRAWTMAEFQGRVFCSTLPSGKIYSFQAGHSATYDHEFLSGWRHVAAVKQGGRLCLYVDGQRAAQSEVFEPKDLDLSHTEPLQIGFGPSDYFCGKMRDLRLYGRTLNSAEIQALAQMAMQGGK